MLPCFPAPQIDRMTVLTAATVLPLAFFLASLEKTACPFTPSSLVLVLALVLLEDGPIRAFHHYPPEANPRHREGHHAKGPPNLIEHKLAERQRQNKDQHPDPQGEGADIFFFGGIRLTTSGSFGHLSQLPSGRGSSAVRQGSSTSIFSHSRSTVSSAIRRKVVTLPPVMVMKPPTPSRTSWSSTK